MSRAKGATQRTRDVLKAVSLIDDLIDAMRRGTYEEIQATRSAVIAHIEHMAVARMNRVVTEGKR